MTLRLASPTLSRLMSRYLLLAPLLSVLAVPHVAAGADDVSLAPRKGVLLLNNGEVIEGTITASGDRYDVAGQDSEIRVKRSDVAIVCRDVLGCYEHKRSAIEQGRAGDHLELAEWCLKHGLVEPAERELEAARTADSSHPKIRLLEPRLELAKQAPRNSEPAVAREKTASSEHLDGIIRNLPAGSMENFTNGIQPMLLNYCAKSGCHGPRSTGVLKLERIPPNRLAGRHATQGNLQAVLAMINRDMPQESKLLEAPIRPHGNMKLPVFTDREQSQYKQLVQWVYLVSNVKQASPRPTLAERTAPLAAPRRGRAPSEADQREPRSTGENPELELADWSDSFPDQAKNSTSEQAKPHDLPRATGSRGEPGRRPMNQRVAPEGDFVPKDPFDPEVFNRRFHGK